MSEGSVNQTPRLLLWDIDGTVLTSRVGARVVEETLRRLLGKEPDLTGCAPHGRTDLHLAHDRLLRNGVPWADLENVTRDYLQLFAHVYEEMRNEFESSAAVTPGTDSLLRELSRTNALSTLLTGNIFSNAVLKLNSVGLQNFFDFEVGAFGEDAKDRSDLLPVALQRIEKKYRSSFSPNEIWIIGDTEHDHKVARDHGCRSALVATGNRSSDELSALEPDVLFDDFSDFASVVAALFS